MFVRMIGLPALDLLVRVLDHHDRGIDHRADCDGDAAQRHDIGVNALEAHHDEGGEHAPGQGDRKSTRLNSSHYCAHRLPSSASNNTLLTNTHTIHLVIS